MDQDERHEYVSGLPTSCILQIGGVTVPPATMLSRVAPHNILYESFSHLSSEGLLHGEARRTYGTLT